MRSGELSYVKDATLCRRTYFPYLQCSCHFHMTLFSANSTSCFKMFNPSEEKGHMHLIYISCQRPDYPLVGAAHEESALAHKQMDCKR